MNESIYCWMSSVESCVIPHLLTLKDYWCLHLFPFSFLYTHCLLHQYRVLLPKTQYIRRLPLMAQPDYQNLSACLAEAAQEFALFRNAPSAITNRDLINSINALRNELRRTAAETRAHIDETKREIETLRTDIMSRLEAR